MIFKTENGDFRVETMIYLFGKPTWETGVEDYKITPELINEIERLATDLQNPLMNTAQVLKLCLEKKWYGIVGLYDS